jgi:hypothetical protein
MIGVEVIIASKSNLYQLSITIQLPCKEDEKNEKPIQPKVSLNQSWLKAVLELRIKTYLLMPGNEGSVPPPPSPHQA